MSRDFSDYSFRNLLDSTSLSADLIIYDIPIREHIGGTIRTTPFSLSEAKAGEIFQKIVASSNLMEKIKIKLDEANRIPRATNTTGTHPVTKT